MDVMTTSADQSLGFSAHAAVILRTYLLNLVRRIYFILFVVSFAKFVLKGLLSYLYRY